MTDPVQIKEMKRYAVVVALKYDHLEIANFLRIARSFVHKIRKELEKENYNVMSVSKRKKHSTRSDSMITPKFIHKVKQTINEKQGQSTRSIAKKVACLKRQSEGAFMKLFDTNPTRWREVNLFLIQKIFKQIQKYCRSKNGWLIICRTTSPPIFSLLTLQISIHSTIIYEAFLKRRLMNIPITQKTLWMLP